MRIRTCMALLGLLFFLTIAVPAAAQEITVFEGADFSGMQQTFDAAVGALPGSWNDRISSVRVTGTWELCDAANFGDCARVDGDVPDLSHLRLNDKISSLRPIGDQGSPDADAGGGAAEAPASDFEITVFEGADFSGRQETLSAPVSALPSAWNDKISSVRVKGSWELCNAANFQDCALVDGDVPDLSRLRLNDKISSLRPAGN